MEVWNLKAIEKSEAALNKIKKLGDFVVIGGWAVYLWTKTIKSTDIDIYVNFDDFYKLQGALSEEGVFVSFNQRLRKYSARIDEIEIDIYTPNQCALLIPCKDVFSNKWYEIIEGLKVIKPEPLLILKLSAEKERAATMKGFKDRCDIIALADLDLDLKFLSSLFKKYGSGLYDRLVSIIKGAIKEYSYAAQKELNPREIKKLKVKLLGKAREIA